MNREAIIREQRTIEAMKNGYMGLEGKFANIAKRLGHPIYHQGSLAFEQTFLPDPFAMEEEDDIPMMEEEEQSYEVGSMFDGLSRGTNLTISLMHHHREIVVRYAGKIVYKEVAGELEGYAPDPVWESKIEELANAARRIEREQRPQERQALVERAVKKRTEIMNYLRDKWGL